MSAADDRTVALVEVGDLLCDDRRMFAQTATFQDAYRPRVGIEGTNSELKRGQGVAHLWVRGRARVELALVLRVTACNVKRVLLFSRQLSRKIESQPLELFCFLVPATPD